VRRSRRRRRGHGSRLRESLPTITVTIARGPGVASVAGDTLRPAGEIGRARAADERILGRRPNSLTS